MREAPLPNNESTRVSILHSLHLLDTSEEEVFDRITRLAASVLNVPIALVSLVDKDRQWFKSRVGLAASETPRSIAFCSHAILQDQPLVVEDTLEDERFHDNPLVTSAPNIRFYAGVSLRSLNGLPLGTLCAIDSKPKTLTQRELAILLDLAGLVTREIRLRETALLAKAHVEQADLDIAQSEALFQTVFERAGVGIAMVAPDGSWMRVNLALCEIIGFSQEELMAVTFRDITFPEDLDKDLNLLEQMVAGTIDRYQLEKRYVHKNGSTVWIQLVVTKHIDPTGQLIGFVSVVKDIQARKETEEALARLRQNLEKEVKEQTRELRESNALLARTMALQVQAQQDLNKQQAELRAVIDNAYDAYVCIDEDGLIIDWNLQAESTFGWSAEEAIGQSLDDMIIPEIHRKAHRAGMKHYLATGKSSILNKRLELMAMRRDGTTLPVELRVKSLISDGHIRFSAFLHDISERKHNEALREQEARHDALTCLLNRRGFFEALPAAIARADRTDKDIALLYIDLDGFKPVNDTLGHEAGDRVLQEVTLKLLKVVRNTDTVARLGGDEFVVILEGLTHGADHAMACANKILAAIRQPIQIEQHQIAVSASIGITLRRLASTTSPEAMVHEADKAMYRAKQSGKNQAFLWKNDM